MAIRINICGIDTSTLPMLKGNECLELLKKVQTGDKEAREKFIMSNLRLVLSIVQRFQNKKECLDDIFQVGCLGLIKAMDNFNMSYNLRFSTYAVPMIIGEIKRYIRDNSAVRISRSIRDTAYLALKTRQMLESSGNQEATVDDIALALDLPVQKIVYAMDAISDTVSLFDPVYHDDGDTILIMDQLSDPHASDELWINSLSLKEALKKLSSREYSIIMKRYYEGKTQIEVSNDIGISQAQVSRLEKNALSSLQESLY